MSDKRRGRGKPFAALLAAERPLHARERLQGLQPGEAEAILRRAALTVEPTSIPGFYRALKTAILERTAHA